MATSIHIGRPADVHRVLHRLWETKNELFVALTLSRGLEAIGISILAVGSPRHSVVHPRAVFWRAILCGADAIVIAHNHPSGNVRPSVEDQELTSRLKNAGRLLGIRLIDHIIGARTGYYSFLEHGKLSGE